MYYLDRRDFPWFRSDASPPRFFFICSSSIAVVTLNEISHGSLYVYTAQALCVNNLVGMLLVGCSTDESAASVMSCAMLRHSSQR